MHEALLRAKAIDSDIIFLNQALLAARGCTVEMVAGNALFGDLNQQINYLKKQLKEIVKRFEKGCEYKFKNDEGDTYLAQEISRDGDEVTIMYWVPYLEYFRTETVAFDSERLNMNG
jgi:hypothetical protein